MTRAWPISNTRRCQTVAESIQNRKLHVVWARNLSVAAPCPSVSPARMSMRIWYGHWPKLLINSKYINSSLFEAPYRIRLTNNWTWLNRIYSKQVQYQYQWQILQVHSYGPNHLTESITMNKDNRLLFPGDQRQDANPWVCLSHGVAWLGSTITDRQGGYQYRNRFAIGDLHRHRDRPKTNQNAP